MSTDRWLPLMWSALGYPGVGQYLQRRRGWALVWVIGFTFFAVLSISMLAPSFGRAFQMLMEGARPIPWVDDPARLKPLYLTLGIYIGNLYDVWWNTVRPPPPLPDEPSGSAP